MNLVPLPTSITQGGRTILVDASIYDEVVATAAAFPNARASSGYRTATANAAAGGAGDSDHLLGLAVDWVSATGKGLLSRLWSWATQQNYPYVEPLGQSGDHVHISYARGDASGGGTSSGGTSSTGSATDALGCSTAILLIASSIVYIVLLPLILHS